MESTVTDTYITRTNQIFSMLNTSIRSLLFDSSEIKNITDAYINSPVYQTDSIASVLIQNDSILTLKDTFLSLSKNYGNQFNFFFYSNQNHKLTEYGGCEYDIRKPFIDHLQRQIDQGTLQYTKEGKWFLDGEYICTIYNGPRGNCRRVDPCIRSGFPIFCLFLRPAAPVLIYTIRIQTRKLFSDKRKMEPYLQKILRQMIRNGIFRFWTNARFFSFV